jgi:hypothetical protein
VCVTRYVTKRLVDSHLERVAESVLIWIEWIQESGPGGLARFLVRMP